MLASPRLRSIPRRAACTRGLVPPTLPSRPPLPTAHVQSPRSRDGEPRVSLPGHPLRKPETARGIHGRRAGRRGRHRPAPEFTAKATAARGEFTPVRHRQRRGCRGGREPRQLTRERTRVHRPNTARRGAGGMSLRFNPGWDSAKTRHEPR